MQIKDKLKYIEKKNTYRNNIIRRKYVERQVISSHSHEVKIRVLDRGRVECIGRNIIIIIIISSHPHR